jgi:hypothetical protein
MTSGTYAEETKSDVHLCTMRRARICSIKPHAEAEAKGHSFSSCLIDLRLIRVFGSEVAVMTGISLACAPPATVRTMHEDRKTVP